jgi:uncharacterized protein with PQ loop repeat
MFNILKFALFVWLIYTLIKAIFRYLSPVSASTKQNNNPYQSQKQTEEGYSYTKQTPTTEPTPKKYDDGEYIDYKEIK